MNPIKRPISVTILAFLYLAVGTLAFVYHFRELVSLQRDSFGMELTELLAILRSVHAQRPQLGSLACACLDRIPRDSERF